MPTLTIDCDIHYSSLEGYYLILKRNEKIPRIHQYRLSYDEKGNLCSSEIKWTFVSSQIIGQNIPLQSRLEGIDIEEVMKQLEKYGYADDLSRYIGYFDTVVVDFSDGQGDVKSYTLIDGDLANAKKEPSLVSLISKGTLISKESPITKALLNQKLNDEIEIVFPDGSRNGVISKIIKHGLTFDDRFSLSKSLK